MQDIQGSPEHAERSKKPRTQTKRPSVVRCESVDLSYCQNISPKLKCQFSIPTDSWITGIDVNSDNQILLSAGKSGLIFLYTEDGQLIQKKQFSNSLWDCGLLSDGKIALLTEEAINVYTSDFFFIWKIKLKNFAPYHMVIDQDNFVITADLVHDKVRIYNGFDGYPVSEFQIKVPQSKTMECKQNLYQTAVAINSMDEICIADPTQPVLRVFSSTGYLINKLPILKDPKSKSVIQPCAICVDNEDRIWFADDCGKHLYVAPMYGDAEGKLAPSGRLHLEAYGLSRTQAMVCTKQGSLVVVDEGNQTAVLQIL